jgi:hypothetical protein
MRFIGGRYNILALRVSGLRICWQSVRALRFRIWGTAQLPREEEEPWSMCYARRLWWQLSLFCRILTFYRGSWSLALRYVCEFTAWVLSLYSVNDFDIGVRSRLCEPWSWILVADHCIGIVDVVSPNTIRRANTWGRGASLGRLSSFTGGVQST